MEIRVKKKVDDRDDSQADGGSRPVRPFATVCREEDGSSIVGSSVLGASHECSSTRSGGLVQSEVGQSFPAKSDFPPNGGPGAVDSQVSAREECVGRTRSAGHSPHDAATSLSKYPGRANDCSHSGTTRSSGRQTARATTATAARLVSPGRSGTKSRTRQFRHHRGSGDRRWSRRECADRDESAWELLQRVAPSPDHGENHRRFADRTLARTWPARLRKIRQRLGLPGRAYPSGYVWSRDSAVPVPGRHTRLRATTRDRFSSRHRELQWPLANRRVAPLHLREPLWGATAIAQICKRTSREVGSAHAGGPAEAQLSPRLAIESAGAVERHCDLSASNRCQRTSHISRAHLPRQLRLVFSPDPRRYRPD